MPVTREQVVRCYRLMLGREPESEAVIREKMSGHSDLWHLIKSFIGCAEFRNRHSLGTASAPLQVDAPASNVEVECAPDVLNRLRDHVQRSWESLGRMHAHYSVLTCAQYVPAQFEANAEAFWATGESQVSWLKRILAKHGMNKLDDKVCIDYGCGVGRLTRPLAEQFAKIHGYDISEPHLEFARERVAGRRNVDLHLLRMLPPPLVSADVFFSLIVLQHNPPPVIALIIRSALASLKPGGLAVFQVPTYELGYEFRTEQYLRSRQFSKEGLEMHCIPQQEVFRIAADTGCHVLEVREQDFTGRWGTDVSNVFVIKAAIR